MSVLFNLFRSYFVPFRVCLVGVKTRRMEKRVENDIFSYLVHERNKRDRKWEGK